MGAKAGKLQCFPLAFVQKHESIGPFFSASTRQHSSLPTIKRIFCDLLRYVMCGIELVCSAMYSSLWCL